MKKLLLILPVILFFWATHAQWLNSIDWLHFIGATIYDSHWWFMPDSLITREQAAKFVSRVAIDQYDYVEENISACNNFSDLWNADPTLIPYIMSVCRVWMMKWRQGQFNPFWNLTQWEAMTIIMRLYTWVVEDPSSERYHKYVAYSNALSFDMILYPDNPISRWQFANRLFKITMRSNTMTSWEFDENSPYWVYIDWVWEESRVNKEVYWSWDCEYYQNVLACWLHMNTCPDYCQ